MTDYTHYAASQLQRTPTLSVFSFFMSSNCKEAKHVWIGWPMNSIVYLSFIIFVSDLENSREIVYHWFIKLFLREKDSNSVSGVINIKQY